MNNIENKVYDVLRHLNWLMEAHGSFAELIEIKGDKVVIRCAGYCAECETDCAGVVFGEWLPEMELIVLQESGKR